MKLATILTELAQSLVLILLNSVPYVLTLTELKGFVFSMTFIEPEKKPIFILMLRNMQSSVTILKTIFVPTLWRDPIIILNSVINMREFFS